MTVGGLVERAKVSKKTFYENFEGLDSCIAESLQTLNIVVGSEMARAAEAADSTQPFARLRAVVADLLKAAVDEPIVATALLASGFGLEEQNAKAWLDFDDIRTKLVMSWYEDERNRTPDLPTTTFAQANAAFAALEYAVLRLLVVGEQGDLSTQVDELTALLVNILSAGGASY
jgi:AcrR family transcriptional regulator